jgi:hypothetical protein
MTAVLAVVGDRLVTETAISQANVTSVFPGTRQGRGGKGVVVIPTGEAVSSLHMPLQITFINAIEVHDLTKISDKICFT